MTTTVESPDRAHFEQCTDDGPFDEAAWSAIGHFDPSLALVVRVARAIRYDTGYDHAEIIDLLRTVRWHKGYVGQISERYDYVACDVEGTAESYYDDEGNEVTCINVQPCTWAIVKLAGAGGR